MRLPNAHGATGKAIKALSLFGGTQVIGIVCSVIRAKLIACWIGPVGVALFGIYNSVIEMVGGATQLNLRQSAVRDISQASAEHRPRLATAVRWWSRRLGLLGGFVMLAASPALSLASFGDVGHWWAFAALAAVMLMQAIMSGEQALMQGTGSLRLLAKSTAYSILGGTAVSIPFFYFMGERGIVPSLLAFAMINMVAAVTMCSVPGAMQPSAESRRIGRGFLRLGAALTVSSLAATGASYAFLSYLNQTAGEDITGIYQAGYTLTVKYVGLIFTALAMEYYPRLSAVVHRPKAAQAFVSHEASLLLCVLVPIVIVFVSAGELLLRLLYSETFLPALPMITIAIGGAIFRAIAYCFSFVVVAKGDGRAFMCIEIASAAIGLTLNIFGYRLWGLQGLGISYAAWYAIYALMCAGLCRWRYGMALSAKAAAISLSAICIVAGAILLRPLGFWQPLTLLPLALLLALYASRR